MRMLPADLCLTVSCLLWTSEFYFVSKSPTLAVMRCRECLYWPKNCYCCLALNFRMNEVCLSSETSSPTGWIHEFTNIAVPASGCLRLAVILQKISNVWSSSAKLKRRDGCLGSCCLLFLSSQRGQTARKCHMPSIHDCIRRARSCHGICWSWLRDRGSSLFHLMLGIMKQHQQ